MLHIDVHLIYVNNLYSRVGYYNLMMRETSQPYPQLAYQLFVMRLFEEELVYRLFLISHGV